MWKVALFSSTLLALHCIGIVTGAVNKTEWWKKGSIIYQVYPRSFKDSNGDGIGDLNGITSKLEHIRNVGATAIWLSPIFTSPQFDFGYDISNFTDIDPQFGTLGDFAKLVAKAKLLGVKVLLDLVPNHSSDQHEWFKKSIKRIKPYDNYYIWKDGKKLANGSTAPPNNWLSVFGGSAWQWNNERQQYYYHQFASAQPDLNYRNPKLRQEMEDVIRFWLNMGVDGFRVDAIIHMFEDIAMRDEPLSHKPGVLPNEYEYLEHLYTKDQNETYDVVSTWRKIMDAHAEAHKTDAKYVIVEAGSPIPLMMRYYQIGVDPFNFMFVTSLHNNSRPSDFVREIRTWMSNMPKDKVANWVVGNHDNSRAASRFGYNGNRADQLSMLSAVLPGITVIYNGDEIGMVDRPMTYEETVDPAGCNAGRERYHLKSRDPARTPFQWDDTLHAGFSSGPKTWLPVHENYKSLNLAKQMKSQPSHFKVFQALAKLKKTSMLREGELEVKHTIDDRVLGVVRLLPRQTPIALLVNFADTAVKLNLKAWLKLPKAMVVYVASVNSGLEAWKSIKCDDFLLPQAASVILVEKDLIESLNM